MGIWVYGNEGIETNYPLIDNGNILHNINEEAATLYDSFYEFDVGDEPCVFDNDGYKAAFPKMKALIEKIKQRLDEINDGSFTVEDYITDQKFD